MYIREKRRNFNFWSFYWKFLEYPCLLRMCNSVQVEISNVNLTCSGIAVNLITLKVSFGPKELYVFGILFVFLPGILWEDWVYDIFLGGELISGIHLSPKQMSFVKLHLLVFCIYLHFGKVLYCLVVKFLYQ